MIALRRIYKAIRWILLFVVSILFFLVFSIPAFIVHLITTFKGKSVGEGLDILDKDYRLSLVSLDILANVTIFNWFDFKNKKNPYGKQGETVSYVLYLREKDEERTVIDRIIYDFIELIDKGHFKIFEK